MIRVLIAEDSKTVATLLSAIIDNDPGIEVVGHATNGQQAVEMTYKLKPDLITMDIRMPIMDGFEATRMIMSTQPTPIIVVSSSVNNEELRITFRAIEEGALSVIEKPRGLSHAEADDIRQELLETIYAMADVKVIKRSRTIKKPDANNFKKLLNIKQRSYDILAIAGSTGAPAVLQEIISSLPANFPIPVVIVQHISKGFIVGLSSWLQGNTLLNVKMAEANEILQPGTVYFAPDDNHLTVSKVNNDLIAELSHSKKVNGFMPSGDVLFDSVSEACGRKAIGIVLTGMGKDGAKGLKNMHDAGAHTIVQDSESAVVYGMPGKALALEAVDKVVNVDTMAAYLSGILQG
ncbi:MAG: chemotaxis response regulator protein-glutamate methylesterase [Legionellales bacterium]|nr:chemotaxis response regulator protein-glutamate methylesterase [Legionellales bacterium]|tara:strand:+ start:7120 stop:8166 length:1047 start_codon:yes stop_codon:yes gene_type:complete